MPSLITARNVRVLLQGPRGRRGKKGIKGEKGEQVNCRF